MGCYTHSLALALQLVALAFLIIATVTAPVTSSLRLAHDGDYSFGVLGYCDGDSCSSAAVGYALVSHLSGSTVLKESVMDSLTKVLIVAPIAGGLTLISCIMNISAHLSRSVSRSSMFWMTMILISFLCFAGSALLCIIAFLLFYPRVDWPTWCLIPAAVLNMASVVLFGLTKKLLPSSKGSKAETDVASTFTDYQNYGEKQLPFDGMGPTKIGNTNFNYGNSQFNAYSIDSESNIKEPLNFVDEKEVCSVQTTELTGISKMASSVSSSKPNYESTKTDLKSEMNSSLSDLKLPSITNPYLESREFVDKGTQLSINNNSDSQPHFRSVSDGSTESNFTSISQRGVNPKYYAGAPNKPVMTGENPQAKSNWQRQQHQQAPVRYDPMMQQMPINKGGFVPQPYNRNVAYNQMPPQFHSQGPPMQRNGYMHNPKPYPPMNPRMQPPNMGYSFYQQQQPLPQQQQQQQQQHGAFGYQAPNFNNQPPIRGVPNNRAHKNGARPYIPPASKMNDGPFGII